MPAPDLDLTPDDENAPALTYSTRPAPRLDLVGDTDKRSLGAMRDEALALRAAIARRKATIDNWKAALAQMLQPAADAMAEDQARLDMLMQELTDRAREEVQLGGAPRTFGGIQLAKVTTVTLPDGDAQQALIDALRAATHKGKPLVVTSDRLNVTPLKAWAIANRDTAEGLGITITDGFTVRLSGDEA